MSGHVFDRFDERVDCAREVVPDYGSERPFVFLDVFVHLRGVIVPYDQVAFVIDLVLVCVSFDKGRVHAGGNQLFRGDSRDCIRNNLQRRPVKLHACFHVDFRCHHVVNRRLETLVIKAKRDSDIVWQLVECLGDVLHLDLGDFRVPVFERGLLIVVELFLKTLNQA